VHRAEFLRLTLAAAVMVTTPAWPQAQRSRPVGIGWVANGNRASPPPSFAAFRDGLRAAGHIDGRDVVIMDHWIASLDQSDAIAVEVLAGRPDLIVAIGAAVPAAHRHAGELPVVFGYSGDPVIAGFVKSFPRPGIARTGMSWLQLELAGKRIDILKEFKPGLKKVAVIANPLHAGEVEERRISLEAAQRQGITIQYLPVRDLAELESAFAAIDRERSEAIVSFPDYFAVNQAKRISELAVMRRLPLIGGWDTQADQGHLFSYGPNLRESARRLAYFVDRIIRGARASDLPIEQPTVVEFVINQKTAHAIGLAVPRSLLLRADRVIE